MNYILENETISNEYEKWYKALPKSRQVKPIELSDFTSYIQKKYTIEDKDEAKTAVNIWKNKIERLYEVRQNTYFDKQYQSIFIEKYANRIEFRKDKRLLSKLRINDSIKVERYGKIVTNYALDFEKDKVIVEKDLNKSNKQLFELKYSLGYYKSFKKAVLNFSKILDKYDIDTDGIRNWASLKKNIDSKIKERNKLSKTENIIIFFNKIDK